MSQYFTTLNVIIILLVLLVLPILYFIVYKIYNKRKIQGKGKKKEIVIKGNKYNINF